MLFPWIYQIKKGGILHPPFNENYLFFIKRYPAGSGCSDSLC
jgi:hypothetical protein